LIRGCLKSKNYNPLLFKISNKISQLIHILYSFCFSVNSFKETVMSVLNYPLSNVQVELMKLFNTNLSDKEIIELKDLLSVFYADKAIKQADVIWDEKGLNMQDMEKWLNSKSSTQTIRYV